MKRYLLKLKWFLIGDFSFQVLGETALAFLPIASKALFDKFDGTTSWHLEGIIAFFILCVIIYIVSSYGSMLCAWKHSIGLEVELRKEYFFSLLKRPFKKFYQNDIGAYISFQSNDIEAISKDYTPPMINLAKSILMFFVYTVILVVFVDWRVALTLLLASVLCTLLTNTSSKSLGASRRRFLDSTAQYTATLKDLLMARKNVTSRTFCKLSGRHETYMSSAAAERYIYGKRKSRSLMLNGFFAYAINISAFVVIALLLLQKRIGIGSAVAALAYIECFVSPLKDILYDFTAIRSVKETKEKVCDELSQGITETDALPVTDTVKKSLVLNQIQYNDGDFHIRDCSHTFIQGNKYAIIGANGSGKSTLLNLIMKRITPSSGEIYIDDANIQEFDIAYLIGILDQDEHIFASSLSENITVFDSYDSAETLQLIPQTSLGGKSNVIQSENIQNTSGGEQRLIGILRVLAQDTPIILLDEPFSSLDENTSKEIMDIILGITDKTIIIVSHNLSEPYLKQFDEIILMNKGRIQISGQYDTLKSSVEFKNLISYRAETSE